MRRTVKGSRFSEEQIVGILRNKEAGAATTIQSTKHVDHCVAVGRTTRLACTRVRSPPSDIVPRGHDTIGDNWPTELCSFPATRWADPGRSDPRTVGSVCQLSGP